MYHAIGHRQGDYDPGQEVKDRLARLSLPPAAIHRYRYKPYFEDIEEYYAIADLVICRAGAGTVWELAQLGIPAILIPKASVPGDHQAKNARFLERMGIARILYEKPKRLPGGGCIEGVDGEELVTAVQAILYSQEPYHDMEPRAKALDIGDSTKRIYDLLWEKLPREKAPERSPLLGGLVPYIAAPPTPSPSPFKTPIEWMTPPRLVAYMEEQWKHRYKTPWEDVEYVHYKTDYLLRAGRWQERNLGVKLAGLSRYQDTCPILVEFITDRSPTTPFKRLLGGDFIQVGFIRRNSLQAIWRICHYDSAVRNAFMCCLTDPYYEVRSWTARAMYRMSEVVGEDKELESLLRKNLKDRWFEVVVESAKALGKISQDPGILGEIEILLHHNNWKVRDAALMCLRELLFRNVLSYCPELEEQLQKVEIICLDFSPYFPIRKTLEEFQKVLYEKKKLSMDNQGMRLH
jgi:UDP-N-acetylglucosamine--N-acetylmuramyl-(pentapeptide) pyrophosphoryl-undecaprenol N-acetylglucosamine transferase